MSVLSTHSRTTSSSKIDSGPLSGFVQPRNLRCPRQILLCQAFASGSVAAQNNKGSDFIHSKTRFYAVTIFTINKNTLESVSIFRDFLRFFVNFMRKTDPIRVENHPASPSASYTISGFLRATLRGKNSQKQILLSQIWCKLKLTLL